MRSATFHRPRDRDEAEMSLRRLGLERIDLLQLHRIDPRVQLEEMRRHRTELLRDEPDALGRALVALAWLLRRSPVVPPIPGTSVAHLEENVASATVRLTDEQFAA